MRNRGVLLALIAAGVLLLMQRPRSTSAEPEIGTPFRPPVIIPEEPAPELVPVPLDPTVPFIREPIEALPPPQEVVEPAFPSEPRFQYFFRNEQTGEQISIIAGNTQPDPGPEWTFVTSVTLGNSLL